MRYYLSKYEFQYGKMFDSNGKIIHRTGNKFKLFPFVTTSNSTPVEELSQLVGTFLCRIEGKRLGVVIADDLIEELISETDVQGSDKNMFSDTMKRLFFDNNRQLKPMNLQMLSYVPHKSVSEEKIAEFLVDVLGDKTRLKVLLGQAKEKEMLFANVLERLVLRHLKSGNERVVENDIPYFRVVYSLRDVFEEDFQYVLEKQDRVREYLISLLEFYFFSYTAQTSLQLDRFMQGERNQNIPLYFCLDWEKTSQSRRCFTDGWRRLQSSIRKIFAHVVTLEILNHTESESHRVDYIGLKEILNQDPTRENEISEKIDEMTQLYRQSITDCEDMRKLTKYNNKDLVSASVEFLFNSVKLQFEKTSRLKPYNLYADNFERFCYKFLKNRGRNGLMLSLSEEVLIFLTKISTKNQEQIRLKDLFEEFEKRGVFLDNVSKEQIAIYYEKLNLIEKKSDSGDAKYVKRII